MRPFAVACSAYGCEQALKSLYDSLLTQGVEEIYFSGNILGFGGRPLECLKLARRAAGFYSGYIEDVILGTSPLSRISSSNQRILVEKETILLEENDLEYLRGLSWNGFLPNGWGVAGKTLTEENFTGRYIGYPVGRVSIPPGIGKSDGYSELRDRVLISELKDGEVIFPGMLANYQCMGISHALIVDDDYIYPFSCRYDSSAWLEYLLGTNVSDLMKNILIKQNRV